jgi:hypothetical protein
MRDGRDTAGKVPGQIGQRPGDVRDRIGDIRDGGRDRDDGRDGRGRDGDWDRDRDHDRDRDDSRWRRYFFRPGFGWWYWRWDPFVGRYYQYYDRNYYGGYTSAYPSYGYAEQPVVEQAALGVTFNQNLSGGAHVSQIVPGSPAEQAGLLPGDVFVAINGGPVTSHQEVIGLVAQSRVGDTLQIEFLRGGQRMTVNVVLGPRAQVFNT